jgi:hypothetical protein
VPSPVAFELPQIKGATDAVSAMAAVMQALTAGDLSATEAAELAKVVQGFAQTANAADLEQRVSRLEEKVK